MTRAILAATLIAASFAFQRPAAGQADPTALSTEGNALARQGLFHAALLRYREAAAAGADSALFHYNLGIVYYRLDREDEAVEALTLAALDPTLEAIATYNLGLIELDRGQTAAAAAAFRHVVDIGSTRTLRRAARERLDALDARSAPATVDARDAGDGGSAADDVGFRVSALARYAQDSNVYRAPSTPYIDQSDPAAPLVTPVVYSASFMPIDLLAAYVIPNEAGDTDFVFGYTLNGDFYDAEFSNANRVSQRFSLGADIDMQAREGRRRRLDTAFYMRTHDETSFNPDDGLDRTLTGADIADRLSYRGAGIDADYLHEIGRFLFGFEINYERRQYEDAGLLANYDHDYYENYGFVDTAIGARTEIGIGFMHYRRIYDERRARDLTGALSTGMDFVEYDYRGVELSLRRLIGNALILEAGLERLGRTDRYVGYYDYDRNALRLGLSYRPNPRLRVMAAVSGQDYEFPRAFAFNNPLAGERELETTLARLEVEYALTDRLALWLELETDESAAADQREQYDRSLAMLGVRWRRR